VSRGAPGADGQDPEADPAGAVDVRLQDALLAWFDAEGRDLPWRHTRDPWAVLVAEAMLQQTQVARVVPRWEAFLSAWPTPAACARAPRSDVLRAWQGLGYNRRARDLHATACVIGAEHGGVVPDDLDALLALPGVGPYTARALLAFAHERDVGVLDVNAGRVLSRAVAGERLTPARAQALADAAVPDGRGWAWNQAVLDLGATTCTRRAPSCPTCPLLAHCAWAGNGPDPAERSAGASGRQSRFEGSDRQGRGRLLDALRAAPLPRDAAGAVTGWDDPARTERVVAGLLADGLAEVDGPRLRLPD